MNLTDLPYISTAYRENENFMSGAGSKFVLEVNPEKYFERKKKLIKLRC
jgi:hypothetical protein